MFIRIPTHIIRLLVILPMLLIPVLAHAANDRAADLCQGKMAEALLDARDEYRAHIFGARKNDAGGISILTAGRSTSLTSPVTGILETRGRLTSELVDPLVESYRVLRCRSLEVCELVRQSIQQDGGKVNMHILGCAPRTLTRIGACFLPEKSDAAAATPGTTTDAALLADECGRIVEGTLAEERAALKLAVGYDSGYRSLLQLSGMMDWMLEGFSSDAVRAIRDMVSMLGKLHQIPCFIGQCDSPVPPAVQP